MSKANADYLMRTAMDSGITDRRELANFMGQMQVESRSFNSMNENLHYSPERLLEKFHCRNGLDTVEDARKVVAGGPEAVANAIYGGKYGKDNLNNTQPGDGWAYHGRGYVQLTGRHLYQTIGASVGLDLVSHPDAAAEPKNAAQIAVEYWKQNVAARGHQTSVRHATIDINGGVNGLAERETAAAEWRRKLDAGYQPGYTASERTRPAGDDRERHIQAPLNTPGSHNAHGQALDHISPSLVQKQTASEAGHRSDATKQNATPGAVAMNAASQPASDQVAASDLHRSYWSDLAAKGRDLMKNSHDAMQTDVTSLSQRRGRTL